ncbi:MAG: hypothetical protein AABX17_01945 [Nanoarchaeota archaeon]
MKTQTRELVEAERQIDTGMENRTETETLPIYTICTRLKIDPTKPGAASEIQARAIELSDFLKKSPENVKVVLRAIEGVQAYENLMKSSVQGAYQQA